MEIKPEIRKEAEIRIKKRLAPSLQKRSTGAASWSLADRCRLLNCKNRLCLIKNFAVVDIRSVHHQALVMDLNFIKQLSSDRLKKAGEIKATIERLEKELTGLLHIPEALTLGGAIRRHSKISAAGRARISAAAKARWARIRAGKQ